MKGSTITQQVRRTFRTRVRQRFIGSALTGDAPSGNVMDFPKTDPAKYGNCETQFLIDQRPHVAQLPYSGWRIRRQQMRLWASGCARPESPDCKCARGRYVEIGRASC